MIRFCVKDENGIPVEGAAVMVGKEIGVSDSTGCGFVREKKDRTIPLKVSLEDFVANGAWEVVHSPNNASPSEVAEIMLRRK